MKRCPQCGRSYSNIVTVCPVCNTAISDSQENPGEVEFQEAECVGKQNDSVSKAENVHGTSERLTLRKLWERWPRTIITLIGLILAWYTNMYLGSAVAAFGVMAGKDCDNPTDKVVARVVAAIVWILTLDMLV